MTDERISLREYVDRRFHDQEKAVSASKKRFESVNEFRGSLADSARLLMPRLEVEQIVRSLEGKIGGLQKMVWVGLGIVLAFQFFLGIALIFLKDVGKA